MSMWLRLALFTVCWAWISVDSALAVVVFTKDREEPVMGFFVREDARTVTIEELQPDGKRKLLPISRDNIADIIMTVSHERLETLTPADPDAYRNYAEELAEKRRDPEARETAIRLYLIAAHLVPQRLGRSSLLGMIDLARSADEEIAFRAMAYLLDPEHDPRVLRPVGALRAKPDGGSAARDDLVSALQLLRRGNVVAARRFIDRPEVQTELEQYREIMSVQDFYQALNEKQLSDARLQKILLLELGLSSKQGDGAELAGKRDDSSWSVSIRRDGSGPVPVLKLESITEFDPQKCQFRGGKWLAPDDG